MLQRLYEVHKIVTYPRTDSRYITKDIVPTLKERIEALSNTIFSRVVDEYLSSGWREDNPRFVNDELVSDHHAIIPTEQKVDVSKLSREEEELWKLIAMRFLEVIGEDYVYNTTTAQFSVEGKIFKTRLTLPVRKGYRNVAEASGLKSVAILLDDDENSFALRNIKEGDEVTLQSVRVKKSATTPPERYTDATLLSAMEHAGRFVDDKSLKENLTNGLGTPATRADMIEKLLQNRYIVRDGKYLVPTAKGREVVRLSPLVLRSAELTGVWEGRLERISKGKEDKDLFIRDIKKMAADLVREVEQSPLKFSPQFTDGKKCPYCGEMMMRAQDADGSVHYICQKLSCQYEEREVKVAIDTGASIKKINPYTQDGKVRLVIKKSAAQLPKKVYETKIEVVRPSKKAFRQEKPNGVKIVHKEKESSSAYSGGTMADFFLKSQKRAEEDKKRKRR